MYGVVFVQKCICRYKVTNLQKTVSMSMFTDVIKVPVQ